MAADPKRYGRLLRVRALQRDLAQADEVQARLQAEKSGQLVTRIAQLVDSVTPGEGGHSALDLAASAGFRMRLHASHAEAQARAETAQLVLQRRQEATKAARQDHGALEKLMDRAKARQAMEDMRKLADAPPPARTGMRLADHEPD